MKNLVHIRAALIVLGLVHASAEAEDTGKDEPPRPTVVEKIRGALGSDCVAVLRPEYVDAIKPVDFLDGNKLTGSFSGFEADFAKFKRKDSKDVIYIPKSAILYLIGKEKLYNF